MNKRYLCLSLTCLFLLSYKAAAQNPLPGTVLPLHEVPIDTHIDHGINTVCTRFPSTESLIQNCKDQLITLRFLEQISNSDRPIILKFYATWCQPCQRMITPFATLAQTFQSKCLCVEIDIDACPKLLTEFFDVKQVPTFIYLNRGVEVARTQSDTLQNMELTVRSITPTNIVYFEQIAEKELPKNILTLLAKVHNTTEENIQALSLSETDLKFLYFMEKNKLPLVAIYYTTPLDAQTEQIFEIIDRIAHNYPDVVFMKANLLQFSPRIISFKGQEAIPSIELMKNGNIVETITCETLDEATLEKHIQTLIAS